MSEQYVPRMWQNFDKAKYAEAQNAMCITKTTRQIIRYRETATLRRFHRDSIPVLLEAINKKMKI